MNLQWSERPPRAGRRRSSGMRPDGLLDTGTSSVRIQNKREPRFHARRPIVVRCRVEFPLVNSADDSSGHRHRSSVHLVNARITTFINFHADLHTYVSLTSQLVW